MWERGSTTTQQPFHNSNRRRPVRRRTQAVPVRSFSCVIESGRLRDADRGSARGAGEHMRFGEPGHAWRRSQCARLTMVVAMATFFQLPCPCRREVAGAYRLQFMAVEPSLQRAGLGTLVLTEGIQRLRLSEVRLLWATARPEAVPFYQRFGFAVGPAIESETADQPIILLDLTA